MTLLEDLRAIDLSPIVDARASISVSISGDELQAILEGGAASSALGPLGAVIGDAQGAFDNPAALLQPVVEAMGDLLDTLGLDDIPVAELLEAVSEGATIIAALLEGLDGDPLAFGRAFGAGFGDILTRAAGPVGDYASRALDDLGQFHALLDTMDRGLPTDPRALSSIALELLLPFPRAPLGDLRAALDAVLNAALTIRLDVNRTSGLRAALAAVVTAAADPDPARLRAALADLERVRASTIEVIRDELRAAFQAISALPLAPLARLLATVSDSIRGAEQDALDVLEQWRAQVAEIRDVIERFEPGDVIPMFEALLDQAEAEVRARLDEGVDLLVERLRGFLRDLLRHLPLRELRARFHEAIATVVRAIDDADLDGPAQAVRNQLHSIQELVSGAGLAESVHGALEDAQALISGALDDILGSLEAIGSAIDDVAGDARAVLERAAAALETFAGIITEVTAAIEGLGIEQAAQQVIDAIRSLREKAEALLSTAPLPEPLRPVVEQLISTLEGIDLDEIIRRPADQALEQLEIPDSVAGEITDALGQIADALDNLVPAELIASIESEIGGALDTLRGFDPSTLLEGVGDLLGEAATFLEALDPRPIASEIRGPFQAVLDAIDAAHPRRLLAPVIEAYDSLLGNLPVPSPETAVRRAATAAGGLGDSAARAATEPMRRLVPGATVEERAADAAPVVPEIEGIRPGDVIRFLGYLPAKLREGLATLDAGPAGEVLASIDGLTGGLAADLRRLRDEVRNVEARLAADLDMLVLPLGPAQLEADLAVRARADLGPVEMDASLDAVANVGPAAIRAEVADTFSAARARTRTALGDVGGDAAAALQNTIAALEGCRLAGLVADLDGFLGALDPEPIAVEIDLLAAAAVRKFPEVMAAAGAEVQSIADRIEALIREMNPGALLQRLLPVLDVLREEISLLDPRRLADELGEVHAALRAAVAAYDPAVFAEEIAGIIAAAAAEFRALDPAALLGDLTLFDDLADRLDAAVPTDALSDIGGELSEVGDHLRALDPHGLLAAIEGLPARVLDALLTTIDGIRDEIVALLEAIRYATASASVSVEAEAHT